MGTTIICNGHISCKRALPSTSAFHRIQARHTAQREDTEQKQNVHEDIQKSRRESALDYVPHRLVHAAPRNGAVFLFPYIFDTKIRTSYP